MLHFYPFASNWEADFILFAVTKGVSYLLQNIATCDFAVSMFSIENGMAVQLSVSLRTRESLHCMFLTSTKTKKKEKG